MFCCMPSWTVRKVKPYFLLLLTLTTVSMCADPPGVTYPAELRQQLAAGLQSQGQDYQARTIS